ncbi:MAG TPA: asparagine synthase-related protein [Vicinamibacterales bacterium]|nr:asparagine synthase-related protein [Vicinamibacterales bacterium]
MSVIAGCLRLDGRPATAGELAHAGSPDPGGALEHHIEGAVVLAGAGPARPCRDPATGCVIVFDGCLDNDAELISALGVGRLGDPALVLAAHDRWGPGAWARLVGDFAFALWDPAHARLTCVRDPMGQRPLFYSRGARCFLWGSEPQQVVRHPEFTGGINEGVVAEYLTGALTTVHETIWRDLWRLPPAHALVLASAVHRVSRYWDFDPEARVHARSPAEYGALFRDVFTEAVECRVRGRPGVGLLLSGGVDSSSVAAVAQTLSRSGRCPPPHALSLTFPGRACDESPYMQDVVSTLGLEWHRVEGSGRVTRAALGAEVQRWRDLPPYPNGVMLHPLRRAASDLRLPLLLTGYGGDDWFTGSVFHAADLLAGGSFASACRQLHRDSIYGGGPYATGDLARLTAAAVLPNGLWRLLRRLRGKEPNRWKWIRPELAQRTNLADRLRSNGEPPFPTRAQRHIYRVGTGAARIVGDEMEHRAARAFGIVQRHPFYDRRVAAFGLALPEVQRRDRMTKLVIRRGLQDLLPPSIGSRTEKAEFSSTFVDALDSLGGMSCFERLRSEEAGWVDGEAVRRRAARMFELYRAGDGSYIPWTRGLWEVAGLELWLEHAT